MLEEEKKRRKKRKKKEKRQRDPVLKVDRLTHIKSTFTGTLYYRLTRIKSVIFPIAGKGPCTKGGQVDPY